ncbi:hypothetical protein JG687_00008746 [Phytophthora cactorum]|uniref:Dynein heavy chain n=2 Tax=Phytophthora cactorum TaxID=29920 RepID=A0A8T1UFZ6_9STRA|nr:hypothetical protein JG687_00008746 [Phytophthora cactorum]
MAFQARHRWMIQRLQLGLSFQDESQVEELLRGNGIMEQLSRFFRADGPTKIFFYYQAKGVTESDIVTTSSSTAELQRKELFVTDGLDETLQGRAVFFAKVAPEASDEREANRDEDPETLDENFSYDSTPRLPLDPAVANDHLLTYGVLDSSVLRSIETHLAQLFVPMLTSREESEWGQAESDTRNEFMLGLKSFVTDVQENLKAMNTGLDLRKPDKRYDTSDSRSLSKLSSDDGAVQHFVELVKDWCKQTEAYLEDNDQGRWESHEAGPATELEYWKRRLQRLMGITEQLKTKECKMVTGVLNVVSKLQDGVTDKLGIAQLLRQWKQIDTNITEASNEAKDNVKYLATLERFIEPLYTGTPTSVIDALPALMNSVKMIHTIARYYNTTERMTKLFMKITNQMITLCKSSLVGREPPEAIWDKDPEALLVGLEACLKLNEAYQEQYRLTKDKLLTMPKGKQFDFSETQIFGKFDLFCRRLVKLIDMFSTIHQFRALALYSLEGMDALLASFNTIIREFRAHKHDLLDYHNNKFDRDYVEFNIQIADLEASLQQFINVSFDSITSIEQSLQLLKQFQQILQRETLRSDLDSKFTVIFHNYGLDLSHVQELYERHRHDPPVARNLPPVAGNILWSRHLLRRIEEPMRKFESNPTVLSTKDSKKIIKTYNKVARTLVAFEYLWYEAWCRSVENARAGLHATLIIRHPETGRLFVNFDKEILQLIREARCLDRMGIEVPENARMVMLQEDKFKAYYNDLSYALHEYDRVTAKIIPVTAVLLRPHLEDLQQKLRPGLVTLTWTSMNIDAYTAVAHAALQRLEELISSVLDAIENRIEKNLVIVSKASLVHLPTDQSFALDDFVRMQEKHVANVTKQLAAKNVEIENAVEDVLRLICEYNLDGSLSSGLNGGVSTVSGSNTVTCDVEAMETFRSFYRNLFYRSLVTCTKQSLDAIKKRVCSKAGTGFLFLERPFFEVDVQLSVPSVRLSPSLDDIQKAINRSAVAVLRCSKSLYEWGQQNMSPETARTSLFERLGCDTEIIKVAILLTGALHGTKNQVHEYLSAFKKYDWLWKEDMEFRYNQFMQRNPLIQDFETELRHFMAVEAEISLIAPVHNIAVLSLNTKNLKLQLRNECRQWKVQYSDKVHQQARTALFNLTDYIRTTTSKLNTRVETLDTLRFVMGVLKEVRERESAIEMELNPIADMYDMLEHYLPGGYMDKEEMDQKSVLRGSWRKLVDYAEEVTDNLSEVQGGFKKQLIKDVKDFQADVTVFRSDYEANGPMVSGLEPAEAVERLKRFKDLLGIRERKLEVFSAGEELFGMRPTEYPEIVRTHKEMTLLDQLYGLYMDVEKTMDEFRGISWAQVGANVERMSDCFAGYDLRCKKMPKNLCEWEAYGILRKVITEFLEMLPIVRELTRESIKPRHWEEIIKACNGQRLPYDSESFKFQDVLDAKLLTWKEDVEYICESAQKQLQIEHKLRDLTDRWAGTTFEFRQGAQDVEKMKVVLKEEEAKLVVAEAAANKMLETLQVKSLEAKKENDIVQQIREQCLAEAAVILAEKEAAEEDLKRAQPFLDEAERAASSIRPNDLNELKKLAKPGDIIKLIFDCVAVLQMAPLLKVERAPVTLGVGKEKHTCDFLMDSFQLAKSGMLADTRFLQNIFYFSKHQKDQMNDETLEFMAPYMELSGFTAPVAKNASKAAEGLFCWVKAMSMYHEASKVVKPKLEALRIAEGKFEAAQARLQSSEDKLQKCQNVLTRLQEDFQTQMAEKARVEAFAQATKRKMEQATALIGGLGGEKVRWTEDSNRFVERKQHLVGDCALAAAFLCYWLEEQLLAQVIRQEQRSLEEQLERVQCELNANAKALVALDALLLERLSASKANLLDDVELVSVLANTKAKATEVNDKILAAEEVKRGIDEKREHYRPVAARGSVLYFGIVDFAAVNAMYQTSLDQFLQLFVRAIEEAERSSLASKRVTYIIETLTYIVFRYVNRGLYDRHRLSFLLMIALKILVAADCVTPADVTLFLKAGASRKLSSDQPKPFNWMSTGAWLNAVQLAIVVERRKFGPLGFSVPYEFNAGDMGASLSFLERHLYTSPSPSWPTVQYMVAEVHYGGSSFSFNPEVKLSTGGATPSSGQLFNYCLPDSSMAEIEEVKEVSALLGTIVDTQPTDAESSGTTTKSETKEEIIQQKIHMAYCGGVRSFVQAAALCALALSTLPSIQAKNVASKQCTASDGDKSFGVYAIKDESCAKNGGLGCFGKVCRYCKVLDTPKSSHLNTCLSYGVAFTSTSTVAVTQGPCVVSSGDVAAGISAVTDSNCLKGGLGCFNDHCRFCKVVETPQSAGFMACSSLDSSYSAPLTLTVAPVTAAPTVPVTTAPPTAAPTVAATDIPTTPVPTVFDPVTDAPTTATEPTTPAPGATTDTPASTTEAPVASSETPIDVTEVPAATTVTPTTDSPFISIDEPTLTPDAPIVSTAGSASTTDAPVISTDEPTLNTDAPVVSTNGSTSTTGAPIVSTDGSILPTDAPVASTDGSTLPTDASTDEPTLTTDAPGVSTDGSISTTGAPIVSTDGSTLPTDAPEVPVSTTEAPVVTTETPAANVTCTLVASVEDVGFGISVGTDPSCSSGGVGCIDEICRFCKITTSLQSAPYADCASLQDGSRQSDVPTADATDLPSETPTETPSATTEAPAATADTTVSPSETPSETPSSTAEAPTATTETPVTTANTPDATSDTPAATTGTPAVDTPDVTSETPVTEPPAVTEAPGATNEAPIIVTDAPVVSQETCGITVADGDIAVGIHIATDTTCSAGGVGCINDLCRFCKVQNTTQSAEFVDCSSLAGFVSDSTTPVGVATSAPGSITPASCDLTASSGDAAVGIRIITDPSCSASGVGCISNVCRFCKVITSVQSEAFIDCVAVDGYVPETETPVTAPVVKPSSSTLCTQVATDGDLAAGVDITTDATCSSGGVGCIDSVCRFCQITATPQSAEFVTCASISTYTPRTAAPVDATTSTPSAANTNVPVTQADCSLVVSSGDAAVGISITCDATCAVGGVGCIDSVCRFCKVMTTVQSAAFADCTSIPGFAVVSDVSADTTTPPTASTIDNPVTSAPATTCNLIVTEGDAAVGIDITADSTCQFGGVGCIDSSCRFCKMKTTDQSAAFIDCPAAIAAATSTPAPVDLTPAPVSSSVGVSDVPIDTNVPVDATEAPATATPAQTPGADFVTKSPDITSDASGASTSTDNSSASSSAGTASPVADTSGTTSVVTDAPAATSDATFDAPTAPTQVPSVVTEAPSSTLDANDSTTPTPTTEAPTTDVDTSDLLTEAPRATTGPLVSTTAIDDSGDWEGSDEGSEPDSDSTYFDSEESLDDIW